MTHTLVCIYIYIYIYIYISVKQCAHITINDARRFVIQPGPKIAFHASIIGIAVSKKTGDNGVVILYLDL